MTTVTIKATKNTKREFETTALLDILAGDVIVGTATLVRHYDADGKTECTRLERININDDHHEKGYGTAAINAMRKAFGYLMVAPDNEDARRLCERIGRRVFDARFNVGFGVYTRFDVGFGVYML